MSESLGSGARHGRFSDAVRRIVTDVDTTDAELSVAVADLFDGEDTLDFDALGRISRSVTTLDDALGSIVSAPSERELVQRACVGAALLCDADIAVLSKMNGRTATVVSAGDGWPHVDRFVVGDGTIEAEVLSTGGVQVQFDAYRTASIAAVVPDRRWSVAAVCVDGQTVGLLHVAAALPTTVGDAFAGYAAVLGGCIERSGLRAKRVRQEQVLQDGVRSWTDPTVLSIEEAPRPLHDYTGDEPSGSVSNAFVSQPIEPLTDREGEVLAAVLTGASNSAVATELVITVDTVKSHMKKILRKFGAANRAELIARYG